MVRLRGDHRRSLPELLRNVQSAIATECDPRTLTHP